jgi:hypothetical protein
MLGGKEDQQVSDSHPRPPLPARAINSIGALLQRHSHPLPKLDAHELANRACQTTGRDDYGDGPILEALPVMVDSFNQQSSVTTIGRLFARHIIHHRLCNRLQIEAAVSADPQITAQPVERPVFIVAPPRSGTTLLHRLLAIDPGNRTPRQWEMDQPTPPPRQESYASDPRIKRIGRDIGVLSWLAPSFRVIHELGADQPEECINLFANELASIWFLIGFDLPGYFEWLHSSVDQAQLYRSHRQQLQLLQSAYRCQRWVLKAPAHLFGLDGLLQVYPDARIIQTHREISSCVASVASLFHTMRGAFHDRQSTSALGIEVLELMERWIGKAMRVREQSESDQRSEALFVDVAYNELISDPLATVRQIYDQLDINLEPSVEEEMRRFLNRNRQHRNGRHHYSLAQFSIAEADVQRRLSSYIDRFAPLMSSGLR